MGIVQMNVMPAISAVSPEASAETFLELGLWHASGRSGSVDLVAAQTLFNVALAKGCRRAAVHRAELAQEMAPHQVAEALREARRLLTRH